MPRRFCEAAGKWKSSIMGGLRFLAQPASTGHGASCRKGDKDRQLTKNNMRLTQLRRKKRSSREGTVNAMEKGTAENI